MGKNLETNFFCTKCSSKLRWDVNRIRWKCSCLGPGFSQEDIDKLADRIFHYGLQNPWLQWEMGVRSLFMGGK